jgi:hypothetical protein
MVTSFFSLPFLFFHGFIGSYFFYSFGIYLADLLGAYCFVVFVGSFAVFLVGLL